ncbi:DNA mismatch repair protein MutL [uncultured Paludibacter sp.]|uniref:DNA mismatch repair protein MutL n=1 Tax=uncultured Paludibacter sp. TaxID=497635 RepID=A0A653AKQ8_9BACT|nr:DNA mismatch repair protein MutL [uncultured Paludibacter sp.]
MSDIIHLLPDSVANQIAAGEVIQRPASVVKELVENAIDAGAKNIQVIIKDGGNTLIQIIDDGIGMSETDARMAFERHATSKINDAADLFALHTFGFRGEALASIAAVAQVELRTRKEDNELGTFIEIAGTRVFRQESVLCDKGTNIAVKNLFFNVPARRRFLKSPSTEMMHIRNEFYRIVLVHPEVNFSFHENDVELMHLPVSNLKMRIEHVFDNISKRKLEQQLLPVQVETNLLSIRGFIGRPEFAQKAAHQYFFVNGRYMRHPYFHKAVMMAYNQLIKPDENPNYFIYFDIDTHNIDVNVHPSKTEIKFENEQPIWSILLASVKESLGKFQVAPALDFDNEDMPDIPVIDTKSTIRPPQTSFNPDYNPFGTPQPKKPMKDWEELYKDFSSNKSPEINKDSESGFIIQPSEETQKEIELTESSADLFQFKSKYILSSVKSGLMMIDQHRAHFRVLYDRFMIKLSSQKGTSQQILFPEILELGMEDVAVMERILPDLRWVGFDIEPFGKHTYSVNGIPAEIENGSALPVLQELIENVKEAELSVKESVQEKVAQFLARKIAIKSGQTLTAEEMNRLIIDLFSCENHQYTPDGKTIITVIQNEEVERKFR